MKIAVYGVAKNEEKFAERCIKSAADADVFVLCDTGSMDSTITAARDAGAIVHSITVNPWRFDMARNVSLGLVPADIDVCVSLDVDEIMEPGWRAEIESRWVLGQTTRMRHLFDCGGGVRFQSDRVHARNGYLWRYPCHEVLVPYVREVCTETPKLLISHHPDQLKSRRQYLDLLQMGVGEEPHSHRARFYYGRELVFYSRWAEAAIQLKHYLDMPSATWKTERAFVMRLLGQCFEMQGNITMALWWFRLGVTHLPGFRDPLIALSEACYRQSMWTESLSSALAALNIETGRDTWTSSPEVWGWKPHDLVAIAAYNLEMYPLALKHGQIACDIAPEDTRLQTNLIFYREKADQPA